MKRPPLMLGKVYHNDAVTQERGMTPEARLSFHQAESGPLMDQMKNWFAQQIDEKRCEPNSGLGSAIAYMQTRWEPLTLFLRIPGESSGMSAPCRIGIFGMLTIIQKDLPKTALKLKQLHD